MVSTSDVYCGWKAGKLKGLDAITIVGHSQLLVDSKKMEK